MTAPLFYVPPALVAEAAVGMTLRLDGAEGHHAATVKRLGVGEAVLLADGAGRRVAGTVSAAGLGWLDVSVATVTDDVTPSPSYVLVQALAKDGRDEQAIETATELGVDEVVPWQAQRSIVQWRGERGERARRKWESVLRGAAKQSRRARVPVLGETVELRGLTSRVAAASCALVLHEEAETPLASVPLPDAGEVLVVVGPEGGITPDELSDLTQAGAVAVRLGPHVLRSSTAGPAALAVLSARGRWR